MNYKTFLPLVALMGATRMHHFGSAFSLPDASLAVFFLAGLFFSSRAFFVALLIEAGLLDYVAISHFGVSDFCVSPAYVFLIPTYFAMWFGGRLSSKFKSMQGTELTLSIPAMATLFAATTSAFLMSNGSFYWLSGRHPNGTMPEYIERALHYYPPYTGYALMYVVLGFGVVKVIKLLPNLMARKTA
ncbi:MAG: hypothetical protein PHN45_11415 [Methylococcales bacterium]|nr:hypothetical protein [Methylococcales bacterium]MDD5755344.1 hypothetical protein [Methylococcales bacterium]